MSKKATVVDRVTLESIVADLEGKTVYDNRSALYKAVADTYSLKMGVKLTPGVVYLRIKAFGITVKTKKAPPVNGIQPKKPESETEVVIPGKQSLTDLLMYADSKEQKKFLPLAKKVLKGSKTAAIKLNCLQCANFQKVEVKECLVTSCPMFLFRPYQ